MRIRAVDLTIDPELPVVTLSGENEEGKTSILNSLWAALGGAKHIPEDPVHNDEAESLITVELTGEPGDDPERLTVEREIDPDRGTRLKVFAGDGTKLNSPQKILERLYSHLTFDPLEFYKMDDAKRTTILFQLAGIEDELMELEREHKATYEKRTEKNRDLKRIRGAVEQAKSEVDLDLLEQDVEAVDIPEAMSQADEFRAELEKVEEAQRFANTAMEAYRDAKQEVLHYAELLKQAEERVKAARETGKKLEREIGARRKRESIQQDIEKLEARIQTAAVQTEAVLKAKEYKRLQAEETELDNQAKHMTQVLAENREDVHKLMTSAEYPLPNMTVDAGGEGPVCRVLVDGIPLSQASSSGKMMVALAIATCIHPELKIILLREASLMTEKTRAVVYEYAKGKDFQVWQELATSEEVGFHIVDGALKGEANV